MKIEIHAHPQQGDATDRLAEARLIETEVTPVHRGLSTDEARRILEADIAAKRAIRIVYQHPERELPERRVVSPYEIRGGTPKAPEYLVAWDHGRNNHRFFRLERLEQIDEETFVDYREPEEL